MDVFALNTELIEQYSRFARSFTRIRAADIQERVNQLYVGKKFWPEPLLQLNPHYEPGGSVKDLVGPNGLSDECAEIFRDFGAPHNAPDKSLKLRKHQAQAIDLALRGKSYVVTTGTGSGKSLCFFIPIIDAVIKAKRRGEGARTRAIIIYPMNALANSQMEELKKYLGEQQPASRVTFARYTGQESSEERDRIKNKPPDILLTNFMMLELLMTRQSDLDKKVIENCTGLKFIVLDELHTYRGRQGADVAMLVRRLRSRVGDAANPPVCIGTSATMASEGGQDDRNRVVAGVASNLFGASIARDAVVTETLRRVTDARRSADHGLKDLAGAVRAAADGSPYQGKTNSQLSQDELAIWVETRLGLTNVDEKPQRARPQPLQEAATKLQTDSAQPFETCEAALRNALLAFSLPEKDRGIGGDNAAPLFAFKLHQFISGAGRLYATLDNAGSRTVTFDGQIFDPNNENKRLYATHFCRNCGQEHHPVTLAEQGGLRRFEKREIDDVPIADDEDEVETNQRWGFLMPEPVDGEFTFAGNDTDYPEAWLEETRSGDMRLKAAFRKTRAELHPVLATGDIEVGGRRCWFMPGRFKFCPACGDFHSDSTRDINRLSALSAEGRSSATTIIISSVLNWLNRGDSLVDPVSRKLLAFTDNRQDAALQAGHFNDFVFVVLLRSAILGVLSDAGEEGMQQDAVGQALQKVLGFVGAKLARRPEWLFETDLKGANLLNAEKSLREALTYRFWIDQRRGWRYTNPNLEQLGLVEAQYIALDELAADGNAFIGSDLLLKATPAERSAALKELLDTMRKGLAVECDALDRVKIESLAGRMRGVIKTPWAIDEDRIRAATYFMPRPPKRNDMKMADEELILRGSPSSNIGRQLKQMRFGGKKPNNDQVLEIVDTMLKAAAEYGLTTQLEAPIGGTSWRIVASAIAFKSARNPSPERDNPFFRELYTQIAEILRADGNALFGLEGREHTAQVEGEIREFREARFRYGEEDQKYLKDEVERLKELREDPRFLPTLFCSPTMELGVDISAMNVVYMRNVPPTPANYAQRGGRAGRSGQAALIVCYCAAQSPHDQYFFQRPTAVVDGIVVPPAIDLRNPDLVDSHLHAEWLSGTGAALKASIAENLDMTKPEKPLQDHIWSQVSSDEAKVEGRARVAKVLQALETDYGQSPPQWFAGVDRLADLTVEASPSRFAKAFSRWRDLLAAAEKQQADATRTLNDYSISSKERQDAERRQAAANVQIRLLLRGSEGQSTDFYVYRYLATEGFLPGYNFPRLPLMAFIPGGQGGKGQRYIQRARFLAVGEFGPGSLVYHEGRSYRVDRALLRESGTAEQGHLSTFATSVCNMCGASHDGEPPETCHVCDNPLGGAEITKGLYRIENVGTKAVERITANDEERRRQGYDLQTTFEFSHASDVRSRTLIDNDTDVAYAKFAPAALVRRINRGLKRRSAASGVGFWIDPKSGYWVAGPGRDAADESPKQKITPVVEDRKNTMLLRFSTKWLAELGQDREAVLATIQHALARGVEEVYQLEEGEIMVEPTPSTSNRRALLFYEAVEGGAGALSRLLNDQDAFRRVARTALEIMHYTPASIETATSQGSGELESEQDARCVAACYRCLLSYFNQPDHELLDRRNAAALDLMLSLARAVPSDDSAPDSATSGLDGCPPYDRDPLLVDGFEIRWIWRKARIAAVDHAGMPKKLVEALTAKGIELVVLPSKEPTRSETIRELSRMLGANRE